MSTEARLEDERLVIKWLLNDDPHTIYQWIPELKWFVSSLLKDRINLDCSLTNGNRFTKFRALNGVRPTTERPLLLPRHVVRRTRLRVQAHVLLQ
ncbi:hypothetical protein HPB52_015833 [Rhipicephalus sanguineus]|uniref:Uncharacterized protein n=1 Tax=Rhipicephalus sanguineus TaxID=34632 RepID=A0A9D4PRY6_RHISA|nr:hypothetical protein HPB52_015833 [Rhipicephalus sanguineus]